MSNANRKEKAKKQPQEYAPPSEKPSHEENDGTEQEQQQIVLMLPDLTKEYEAQQKAYQLGHKAIPASSEEVDISPYVSNVNGSVYAISGLPEEFIAALIAYVSRSPKSFKDHLREAIKEFGIQPAQNQFLGLSEKAKAFHEKWTVGYGHSSVAENAVSHVGIESISRLASAELELANPFLSITEYSQRYQKPERTKWHNPFDFDEQHDQWEIYNNFMHKCFDAFEKLVIGINGHLYEKLKNERAETGKITGNELKAIEKLAFEDARYVLPLAMHTQLGMTANGRAWRDALAMLGNSDHEESKKLAGDICTEVSKVLPVLLKYATPSQYQVNSKKRMKKYFGLKYETSIHVQPAQLLAVESENNVIDKIIALLQMKHDDQSYARSLMLAERYTNKESKEEVIKELLHEMQHFDMAPEIFKHVQYQAAVCVSEANWHQLLRHNRKTDFTFTNPSPHFGITIPPRIVEAGLIHLLKDIAAQSKELYNNLVEEGYEKEAEYVVLNAHRRQIFMSFNLWEAYHLINLRTSEHAQWDIRETFEDLYQQLKVVHPLLISQAKRRL